MIPLSQSGTAFRATSSSSSCECTRASLRAANDPALGPHFGPLIGRRLPVQRPAPIGSWHQDEMFIRIGSVAVRQRGRKMQGSKLAGSAQQFAPLHAAAHNTLSACRHLTSAGKHRLSRAAAFSGGREAAGVTASPADTALISAMDNELTSPWDQRHAACRRKRDQDVWLRRYWRVISGRCSNRKFAISCSSPIKRSHIARSSVMPSSSAAPSIDR